ncbi:hypothetical protein [Acidianus sp. HS-5]|uniref:hypothetical protein n=1 Tax=Acidianus sp. HS-5 TaxID=2886040 RepID=UPI001F1A5D3A|nr:hypothetical protein [Acidianus sp. HS-5]BDC19384.1 hypothetical protein HS5_22740 [Acidianus sp. HS-5]
MDTLLIFKITLIVIAAVTSVFGVSYIILTKFAPSNINRKDLFTLGSILVIVGVASFLVSFVFF